MSGVTFNHRTIKIVEWERNKKTSHSLSHFPYLAYKREKRERQRAIEQEKKIARKREKIDEAFQKAGLLFVSHLVSCFVGNLENLSKFHVLLNFIIINFLWYKKKTTTFFSFHFMYFSTLFNFPQKIFHFFFFGKKKKTTFFWVYKFGSYFTTPKMSAVPCSTKAKSAILSFSVCSLNK